MIEAVNLGATPTELDVSNSGPALLANRVVVSVGHVVRISFLEQHQPDRPAAFRTAVAMSHGDAIALKDLLTALLADAEMALKTAGDKSVGRSDG